MLLKDILLKIFNNLMGKFLFCHFINLLTEYSQLIYELLLNLLKE
jgi:hypothetical protein